MYKVVPYIIKEEVTWMSVEAWYSIIFDMSQIKRVYITTHFDTEAIRAWHDYMIESHWFSALKDGLKVKWIEINNWKNLSDELKVLEHKLTLERQQILYLS